MSTTTTVSPPRNIPNITLVVNTYEAPVALEKVLLGLSLQTVAPRQIIIADDGSGAATAAVIAAWRPRLAADLLHVWQPHEGFRRAIILNQAIAQATGNYLVFLDGDCPPIRALSRIIWSSQNLEPGFRLAGVSSKNAMCRIFSLARHAS